MSAFEKEYTKGTCYHGYAGIAIGIRGPSRSHGEERRHNSIGASDDRLAGYELAEGAPTHIRVPTRDVTVLTIAAARQDDQSFSADTGMAETMIVFRESSKSPRRTRPVHIIATPT